ncbi:MAG: F0F1 ATP synthase subunit A, partial [Gammaproteobacteria bacterium]|nr:F0F1 ATP synthase subunit A [Gammaproteobacteria bacterium]
MAASDTITSGEFIRHHLTNLTYGRHPDGNWGLAESGAQAAEMGFMALHLDSLGWSFALGAVFLWLFHRVARRATADQPDGLQNFVEWIVEFVDDNVRGSFSGKNDLVAPMALTLFCWIFLMNLMDLVPVEVVPR